MTETITPDGVTTITLNDGRRLSYGPAITETGDHAGGYNWTRYSAGNEIEAQDWAPTREYMAALVKQFKAFTPQQRVRFEVEGEMREGWYVGRWTEVSSRVTLIPPAEWTVSADGAARPETYIRADDEIHQP